MNKIPTELANDFKANFAKLAWFNRGEMPDQKKPWYKGLNRCWEWGGHLDHGGYGILPHKGKRYAAHRISFMLHHGDIPDGMVVRHRCDNSVCTNPDHLELGTAAQNVQDKIRRERSRAKINAKMEQVAVAFGNIEDAVYYLFDKLADIQLEEKNAIGWGFSQIIDNLRDGFQVMFDKRGRNAPLQEADLAGLLSFGREHHPDLEDKYPKLWLRPDTEKMASLMKESESKS